MPFEIIRDDITHVKADAIVNTANPNPVIGAGTDTAIHRAAGPKLLDARKRIGNIPVGTAAKTAAFGLPAKYVLHTVSPVWTDGTHGEEAQLRSAYDAALKLAHRLRCKSVAFPLLSSGSCGFPKDRALSVAIAAFTEFLLTHELTILLVVFGEDSYALAHGLFGGLRSYIDDRYVDEATEAEYGGAAGFNRRRQLLASYAKTQARREETPLPREEAADSADTVCFQAARKPEEAMPRATKPNDLSSLFEHAESTFSEHLLDLLRECGEKDSDVYRRAEISRQLFHKIIGKKEYQPTKSTAIQLALGLGLNLAETQKLLSKAGYALTRSSKTDLVVQYFIERGEYSIVTINTALFDCGLPLLKTGSVL